MKNIKISILTLLGAFSLVGCDHVMDTKPMDSYSEEQIWSSRVMADAFVRGRYNNVFGKYYGTEQGNGLFERRTPNMIGTVDGQIANTFVQDLMDNNSDDFGLFDNYGNARSINMIMAKAKEYTGKGLTETDAKELTAQALLLRAMLYFPMTRACGRIVYVDQFLSPTDTLDNGMQRFVLTSTVEDSYNLLIKDIEAAIPGLLKEKKPGQINKYVAYALMTDVCLSAAAYQPDQAKRVALLKKVVEYADLVEAEGGYSLYEGTFGDIFNENEKKAASEIILAKYADYTLTTVVGTDMQFTTPNASNDQLKSSKGSPNFVMDMRFSGWGASYPTQNLSDAYLMIDDNTGMAVKWPEASQIKEAVTMGTITTGNVPAWALNPDDKVFEGYNLGEVQYSGSAKVAGTDLTTLMHSKRDARLASTLVLDNTEWLGETVRTRFRGNLGRYSSDASSAFGWYRSWTNLYLRKGFYNTIQDGRVFVDNRTAYHWVIFRLGRVVLNKAEAQLWLARDGGGSYSDAVATLNRTRTVHGKLPASNASSSTQAWNDYITERRAELAYEGGDFYWSALRWGLHGGDANKGGAAGKIDGTGGKAMWLVEEPTYIEIAPDGSSFYVATVTYQEINKREFRADRRYLLPIPQGKLQAYPFLGAQNPGWN